MINQYESYDIDQLDEQIKLMTAIKKRKSDPITRDFRNSLYSNKQFELYEPEIHFIRVVNSVESYYKFFIFELRIQ